ncbi:hypothetical protein [Pedobacter alluvionis]|uniref:Uncharacterized protein n=1 Tax=Pedobacter alluvionis TaxID=475253 RepID=A0A497Y3D3_9SPHI|nr:hypothetical protein [Pedobacter alluvionis]RLJ77381.1 hypothetical protein BCL90_2467 [Pedobacter alluvionis]TFB33400.1 hypothetical protein E3V97_04970 [Pedobacter alluvionis]
MIETEITILVNRKSDISVVKNELVGCNVQFPIYLLEYENYYELNFTSNYEEWELDTAILRCFPDYTFVTDRERGQREIRIEVSRHQSEFATDGWGRPIENPLHKTMYLVKRSNDTPTYFIPEVKVLFGDEERNYYLNIVSGTRRRTDEKGFLLLNLFKNKHQGGEVEIFQDALYKTPSDAVQSGLYKMKELVNQDFEEYNQTKKKEKRALEKLPRKMIRDFINSCNNSDFNGILKDLTSDVIFEKRINWQAVDRYEGIAELKSYMKLSVQDLCSQGFKIRSSWHFDPNGAITIGIKYYPLDMKVERHSQMKYRQLIFRFKAGKISSITEDK